MYIERMFEKRYELFGESVFTSFRSYEGSIPYLAKHLNRLWRHSCQAFALSLSYEHFYELFLKNLSIEETALKKPNHYFRLTFFSNEPADLNISYFDLDSFELNIITKPLSKTENQEQSLALEMSPFGASYPVLKTGNYFPHLYFRRKAINSGYTDVLFYNEKGNILEASTSNIVFQFKENFLIPRSSQIFEGITLMAFQDFCQQQSISYSEVEIHINDLEDFTGAFLLNSVKGPSKVISINDISFKSDDDMMSEFIAFLKEQQ